jgi:hypothetical protein
MNKACFFGFGVALLAVSTAVAQDVSYNFAAGTDFTKFRTYKWVSIKDSTQLDQITAGQLTAAIDAALAMKGLTKTASDDANLYVGYQTAVGSEKQINSYSTDWGYGAGWRYGGGSSISSATTSTIYIGQLNLDMYDSASKSLVWRGAASKALDPKAKPDKRVKNINKAVEKLLKNYPPKAKT